MKGVDQPCPGFRCIGRKSNVIHVSSCERKFEILGVSDCPNCGPRPNSKYKASTGLTPPMREEGDEFDWSSLYLYRNESSAEKTLSD